MLDLRLSAGAEDDLVSIWRYTAHNYDADAADEYLRGFNGLFSTLRDRPEIGAIVADILPEMRSFLHRRHRIFYRLVEHRIEIVRIAHVAQHARLLFE